MRQDKYTDFDLELRSMLQDAEEEVSSRVWDALSSELDRRDSGRKSALWWRRAAAGIGVAAAAVSCFLFFGGRTGSDAGIQAVSPSATFAQSSMPESKEDASIEEQIASTGAAFLADVPASVMPSKESADIIAEETVVTDSPETENHPNPPAASQKKESGKKSTVQEDEDWTDPFAELDYMDAKAAGKHRDISITIDGSAATNDRKPDGAMPHRKPSSSTSAGVTEKSTSIFGVPVSFGLGVRFSLNNRLSVGTGLSYSLLTRSFTGIYNSADGQNSINSDIHNELHYLGVPVNLYMSLITSPDLKFYVWGGGSIEKGLVNKYRIYNKPETIIYRQGVDGVQLSTAAGLGIEFKITDHLGLYVDPSVRYYFDCNQPGSIRTMKPFMMNFEAGFRFDLK